MAEFDKHGFKSKTFDDDKVLSILSNTLMRNVNKKLPRHWQTSHTYFMDGYISLVLYLMITIFAYYYQLTVTTAYHQYMLSPFLAFGALGLFGCGHEAKHKAFAPPRSYCGRMINTIMTFIGLDCVFAGSEQWRITHHIYHHKTVNQWPPDDMRLFGNNCIVETFWTVYVILNMTCNDILYVFGMDSFGPNGRPIQSKWYKKIVAAIGVGLRLLFWGYSGYKCQSIALGAFNFLWAVLLANYLVLVSHSLPVRSKPKTQNYGLLQMRETWDVFPQSKIGMFVSVGFGAHASHHIFGYLPRQLLPVISAELKNEYPNEYRCIETVRDGLKLMWNRHQTM